jgi:hypothetical protein
MGELMQFRDAVDLATAHVYLIEWLPDDWPARMDDPCHSYVVALSIDEATSRLTSNPHDIKRVTVLGPVVERVYG